MNILGALLAGVAYIALAWWMTVRFHRAGLIALWLAWSLGLTAVRARVAPPLPSADTGNFLLAVTILALVAYGLAALAVERSVREHPDPPAFPPARTLVRALGAYVLGLILGAVPAFFLGVTAALR